MGPGPSHSQAYSPCQRIDTGHSAIRDIRLRFSTCTHVVSFFPLQSTYLEVMTMRRLGLRLLVSLCASISLVGQSTPSQAPAVSSAPQLDHFDARNVDPSVN